LDISAESARIPIVAAARRRVSESEYNRLSVRLELQADFLAGVWAQLFDRVKHVVEAAISKKQSRGQRVGDDRLQIQVARSRRTRFIYPRHVGTTRRWFRRDTRQAMSQGDTSTRVSCTGSCVIKPHSILLKGLHRGETH